LEHIKCLMGFPTQKRTVGTHQGFDGVPYTKQNIWNTLRVSWGALHKVEQLEHIKGFIGCPTQNRTIGIHQGFHRVPYT
jgi:hypothetical protein